MQRAARCNFAFLRHVYEGTSARAGGADDPVVDHWTPIFDEVYADGRVMVRLMHPWLRAAAGNPFSDDGHKAPRGLEHLVQYMQGHNGVVFTTRSEATDRYLAHRARTAGP